MAISLSRDKKYRLAFTSWWVIWSVMHIIVMRDSGFSSRVSIIDSLVSNLLLAACCFQVSNNMRYYRPQKEKYWYSLGVAFILSGIWLLLVRFTLWWLLEDDAEYLRLLSQTSSLRYAIAFLIIGCMIVINLLVYALADKEESNNRKAETERLNREAELFKLRQQLHPHFLFNSLNSISALTSLSPGRARDMIDKLSSFLRGTLKKDDMQWVTLQEEVDHAALYLEIEKLRFGHRLQTRTGYAPETLGMKLPSLLLQPLVENAIKFGLYDTLGEVMIVINAKNKQGNLEVTVDNPFDEETSQPLHGTGFGLSSIKRRLYLLFFRHDLVHTRSSDGRFYTTVIIPQPVLPGL